MYFLSTLSFVCLLIVNNYVYANEQSQGERVTICMDGVLLYNDGICLRRVIAVLFVCACAIDNVLFVT